MALRMSHVALAHCGIKQMSACSFAAAVGVTWDSRLYHIEACMLILTAAFKIVQSKVAPWFWPEQNEKRTKLCNMLQDGHGDASHPAV